MTTTSNASLLYGGTRTAGAVYSIHYYDGVLYEITASPRGYILGGVVFATIDGALDAIRKDHERRVISCAD